jgi:siroheme synthase (precorrin-2 oxidase/ferrochelatase)
MLDVTDRPVVIIGGGRVAARKAAGLIAAGARDVTVVSPAFDERMPGGVKRMLRGMRRGIWPARNWCSRRRTRER